MSAFEADPHTTLNDSDDAFARLSDEELYWKDREDFLESHGYMLRPRYRKDWVPSWRGKPREEILLAEDAFVLYVRISHNRTGNRSVNDRLSQFRFNVMDATRISDGALVYVKRISTDSEELAILSYLNSGEIRQDPRNHCIPLLDVLHDPFMPGKSMIVMPFARYIDSPGMERVEDILDCVDQILEVSG